MLSFDILEKLSHPTDSKIILLVLDGVGGLQIEGKTELEHASTPHLDSLAKSSICGMLDPISPGITPGSGPGHLGLFGYEPLEYDIGRGVLEAVGINFPLQPGDLAARINFATVDEKGLVTNRRAGRIPTEVNIRLCEKLEKVRVGGVEVFVRPVKEHRAVVVFRGKGLSEKLADTDPQTTGVVPLDPRSLSTAAEATAKIVEQFISQAREILASEHPANMLLLRGFAELPHLPPMSQIYNLHPAAIALYPMYKGLASLVGMEILATGNTTADEFTTLEENYQRFDFFFIHIKQTDSRGEDGDWKRKVEAIEEVDCFIPRIRKLNPEVIMVTGDHSTPAVLKSHSWHAVPFLLHASTCRVDDVEEFSEKACLRGGLGRMESSNILTLALAHAGKLDKYGA